MKRFATQIGQGGAHPQTLRTTPEPRLNGGHVPRRNLRMAAAACIAAEAYGRDGKGLALSTSPVT